MDVEASIVGSELLDTTGRSARPPHRLFYVAWGRARLRTSRLYRDRGWARYRVQRASDHACYVRIYEGKVEWVDVTDEHQDLTSDSKVGKLLSWAGENPIKHQFLEESELAEFVMRHPGLDRAVDRVSDIATWFRNLRARRSKAFTHHYPRSWAVHGEGGWDERETLDPLRGKHDGADDELGPSDDHQERTAGFTLINEDR